MIRFLTEFFRSFRPTWLRNQSQPIASENVVDYLMAGLQRGDVRGGIFEMGGPERMRYSETMLRYARFRGLSRHVFTLPGIPIWFMAIIVDWLTPVLSIATALVGPAIGFAGQDETTQKVFPEVKLIPYEQAIGTALRAETRRVGRVWEGRGVMPQLQHEVSLLTTADWSMRRPPPYSTGWFTWAGGTAGRTQLDVAAAAGLTASPSHYRNGRAGTISNVGDEVDYYRVEALVPDRLLRLFSTLRAPGDGWIEWRVEAQTTETSLLTQTAFFGPRGLPGFLYWFALGPMHRFVFRGLIGAIKRSSEAG
jgi:hypothetical protein